jgi:hypothetical protein
MLRELRLSSLSLNCAEIFILTPSEFFKNAILLHV